MVGVIAKNFVKADNMDEFLKIAEQLVIETKKENGAIIYTVFRDKEKEVLVFMELWQDKESLDAHFSTNHFIKYASMLEPLTYKETELEIFYNNCL